ncbi:MAG TPA: hypothetical protein VIG90_01725 [Pedomonas sp.]|uniref:YybH family protein n=1 Tax=Pedomonas sp. TaxID=2976421 RepID=UPI002F3EC318
MRPILMSIFATILSAGSALADDAGVNANYDRMSAAYEAEDASALEKVYAPEAIVFPSQPNAPWVVGREHIVKGPGALLAKARSERGALQIRFRVTGRQTFGSIIIDTGLYRLSIAGPAGKDSVQVGKFMTVSERQPDGTWAFVADTDTPMPTAAWDGAKPFAGAKFDH